MIPSDLFVLLLDHRARFNSRYIGANSLFDPALFLFCNEHGLLRGSKLCLELLKLRWLRDFIGGRSATGSIGTCVICASKSAIFARDRNYVRMIRRVECLQFLLLGDKALEFLPALIAVMPVASSVPCDSWDCCEIMASRKVTVCWILFNACVAASSCVVSA